MAIVTFGFNAYHDRLTLYRTFSLLVSTLDYQIHPDT